MHPAQQMVRDFHVAMNLPVHEAPTWQGFSDVRIELIREEFKELQDACYGDPETNGGGAFDTIETIDALCDLLYVVYGFAVALGVDLEPFFEEVHRTNMLKFTGPKRADGKQLKPEGWLPPDIQGLFDRLYNKRES